MTLKLRIDNFFFNLENDDVTARTRIYTMSVKIRSTCTRRKGRAREFSNITKTVYS